MDDVLDSYDYIVEPTCCGNTSKACSDNGPCPEWRAEHYGDHPIAKHEDGVMFLIELVAELRVALKDLVNHPRKCFNARESGKFCTCPYHKAWRLVNQKES